MTFGLRLTLTGSDRATLSTLASRAPHLVDAPWEERAGGGFVGIFCEQLDADIALDLKVRGLDVVSDGAAPAGTAAPARAAPADAIPRVDVTAAAKRVARGLIEAVRPVLIGDAVPAEALFFSRLDGAGAQRTVERLLLLERDDAQVGEVDTEDGRCSVVRVATPPLYLLLRAREEPAEGVRVFARDEGGARLYTAWGTAHPLAALLEDRLARADRTALVERDGRIVLAPSAWDLRPILDAIQPSLSARADTLAPAPGALAFPVRLRTAPADPVDPELWILTPEQLFRLETFVDTSPADDVGRLLVSRVAGEDGRARYIVRESVRPQVTRLGPRVAAIVGAPGFARAPALDNLYLPPGKRLVPQLNREQLKALLGLDAAAAVIVDEDADGLLVTTSKTLEDAPLSRFTTWVATDRRAELDRLFEDAVLSFPGVIVERPGKPEAAVDEQQRARERAPRSPREGSARPTTPTAAAEPALAIEAPSGDVAALRAEARALEDRVLGADAGDARAWRALGRVKATLEDADDARACLEVAVFLGGGESAPELAAATVAWVSGSEDAVPEPPLVELALGDAATLTREGATILGARILAALHAGDVVDEEILQHTLLIFLRDPILVGRRLQWAVLHAICARARDALGATRAKETVLGGLNARGLSETLDLPRFVRTALALLPGDGATVPVDRTRHEQLVQLEKLFARAVAHPLKLTDAKDAFLRAIFAVGLGRLGGRAPEIVRALQAELDAHDAPNRALLRLYIARLSHFVTKGTVDAWKKEVEAVVGSLPRPEDRRVVEWLVKRSLWLRPSPPEEAPPGLRPALERHLAAAERHAEDLAGAMARVQEMSGLYDYEVATAIERLLRGALGSGRDEIIRATLRAALKGILRIRILAHRVKALGSCVKAAATLEDGALVDECLDGIAAAARSPHVPSVKDLMVAVKPALQALRRLGAVEAAQRFLTSLEPVAVQSDRETGLLLAALAEGFLQLGDVEKAKRLVSQALGRMNATTAYVDRYETGAAVLEALTHWDLEARAEQCRAILADLPKFTDTFTTSRFFHTHQILIAERLVETIVDDVTLRSDRLQAYLDGEEQAIRRRILHEWSALCGR